MIKIRNKFLLLADEFMLEMYSKQPRFMYDQECNQKFKETGEYMFIKMD